MQRSHLFSLCTGSLRALTHASQAFGFCGFYVAPSDAPLYADASMVALMREGTRTVLSMSNNYKGPAEDFAMVVPVPVVLQKEQVRTLKHDVFKKLESLSAPRLVEYWEQDPCYVPPYEHERRGIVASMPAGARKDIDSAHTKYKVTVEAQFTVGEYEVVILSAEESDGLERWLTDNKYKIPKGSAEALAPYVKEQQKFFVAKVDVKKVQRDEKNVAVLSPLRFHYESNDFRLPVRLGLLNAQSKQDLIVYILSKAGRYETANYKNVFIPTNIDVKNETRTAFALFYTSLFDSTLEKHGGKAVVTEYSWASSTCDPCPIPPLENSDVATLGGDVLLGMATPTQNEHLNRGPSAPRAMPGGYMGGTNQPVVLTRLHTRYDRNTLGEDLVFKLGEPVVGGREHIIDSDGSIETGARTSSMNNFQARYAIRHAWEGAISCIKPKRGVWGGPPRGQTHAATAAATNLANTPRGTIQYANYVASRVDDLGVKLDAPKAATAPQGSSGSGLDPIAYLFVLMGGSVFAFMIAAHRQGHTPT